MKYELTLVMPKKITRKIDIEDDEFILDAVYRENIDLPNMCRQGYCLTCACKLLEGKVEQSEAVRIFPQDIQGDFVLICSAKPLSNIKILTNQRIEMQRNRIKHNLPTTRG